MGSFSEKVYLQLKMPTEEMAVSDHRRVELALNTLGYQPVSFPLKVLRKLYPLCRNAEFDITVTLVHRESEWVVTAVEPGDTTAHHYGLAVDYGSTTIVMRLLDLHSGAVIGEETAVNGQVAFGTDILTRITYAMEGEAHAVQLQQATAETFHRLLEQITDSTGIPAAACPVMILSGNTTMIHFLLHQVMSCVLFVQQIQIPMNPLEQTGYSRNTGGSQKLPCRYGLKVSCNSYLRQTRLKSVFRCL